MRVHVVSETEFMMKATGVHTAFIDHVALLKECPGVEVVINDEGDGDVFHSHTYGLYYFWKGRRYRGRRVFTAHVIPDSIKGSLPLWPLFKPVINFGLKIVYSYADVCVAISPMVEKAIKESGARTRIARIYNPIHTDLWKRDTDKRSRGRKLLGISSTEFVIIGSGQLIGRKGIDDFIDVASHVPGARFIWVGGRPFGALSEGIARINEKIRNASQNFTYAGNFQLDQMPDIYAAADLMLFPSFQENCPLAPIEAAASGMPVIYRDLEEYRSLYELPYLKAADMDEFVSLTKQMMSDIDFYMKGLHISEKLITQFNKTGIKKKLISVYTDLIDSVEITGTRPLVTVEMWG
jgi:1,2-diacylglycerol-3-alpha-glucose alpha-1,2-galactosyltransferase